jgi:predicted DNA-binding antitoxin AbrB/MazE fold protein
MSIISAVYENGVFRPTEPLAFKEGETVSLIVAPASTNSEWEQRIRNAKTIHEWIALANASPGEDSDFDIVKAINESRRLTGFRMPDPEPTAETKP